MTKNFNSDDKIFIAGASGMVGSAIKRAFIKEGYSKTKLLTPLRADLDLLNLYSVEDWFKKNSPDIVVIAAAKVGGIQANNLYPYDFLIQNLKIQNNLIETSYKFNVKRLLFLGSSCIYPKYSKQPIKEEFLLNGELEPTNEWYAIAKIAGIKLCEALRKQYSFDAISLLPTNLYGPGDNYHLENSHVLPALIRKFHIAKTKNEKIVTCWGSGSPEREFLHVDDLANACLFVLKEWDPDKSYAPKDEKGNPLFHLNVGTGKDISIKKLAENIANFSGYKGEIVWDNEKPDGTPKKLLSVKKINKLGWYPKISLEEGIKSTIKTFQEENTSGEIRIK